MILLLLSLLLPAPSHAGELVWPKQAASFQFVSRQDPLARLISKAAQASDDGHWWETRRLYFKLVDMEPDNLALLVNLAYSLDMMKNTDEDALIGKNLSITFQESDFKSLGGIKDKALLAIATNSSLDGLAKARALYQWAEPKQAGNAEFLAEYGFELGVTQASYLMLDKLPGGLGLLRQSFQKLESAAALYRPKSDPGSQAALAWVLMMRANMMSILVEEGQDPANAAADTAQADKDYQEILSLPAVSSLMKTPILGNNDSAKEMMGLAKKSARRHLGKKSPLLP